MKIEWANEKYCIVDKNYNQIEIHFGFLWTYANTVYFGFKKNLFTISDFCMCQWLVAFVFNPITCHMLTVEMQCIL